MPMTFRLGYLDLGSTDVERDAAFYTDVIGLVPSGSGSDAAWLSLGFNDHDLCFRSSSDSLLAVGYQLTAGTTLDAAAAHLSAHGIPSSRQSDPRPGITALLECEPVPGHRVQLFKDMAAPARGFAERGVAPLRLGHFAFMYPDSERKLDIFYRDILGFHYTDSFGEAVNFYTCSHEHHVLNIVNVPHACHRLHHLAFQLRDYSAHSRAADALATRNVSLLWGPSRHTAGHNIASYFRDSAERLVELYADMDVFLPDAGMVEPRPWHKQLPMRPQRWAPGDVVNWKTSFEFELSKA
ncbi:VOC family protein [Bradyrhizobium guangdongense]